MRQAGASEGLFYLCRAAQHFLHVQLKRIILFIFNLRTLQRDVRHIKHFFRTRKHPQPTFAPSRRCPLNTLMGVFYVLVPREEENAEEPGLGFDLYCRNYSAMADLQISPFSAAQAANPPPFLLRCSPRLGNSIPADTEALINVRTSAPAANRKRAPLSFRWNSEASKVAADLRSD